MKKFLIQIEDPKGQIHYVTQVFKSSHGFDEKDIERMKYWVQHYRTEWKLLIEE